MKRYKVSSLTDLLVKDVTIIINEDHPKSFFIVEIKEKRYGIAFNGYAEPEAFDLMDYELAILGAGESIVAINSNTGLVKLALGLGFPLNFIKITEKGFYVVSELTIIGISSHNCSIYRYFVSSDVIVDVEEEGEYFIVKCLDSTYKI